MPAFSIVFSESVLVFTINGYDRYGQSRVDPPFEMRWLPSTKLRELIASTRTPDVSVAADSTALVEMPVAVGSVLWPGTLEDWLGTGSNKDQTNLLEVKVYKETPDMKSQDFVRQVGVMRYKHTVPYG